MADHTKKHKENKVLKNKDAVEFMLVNRGVDDPFYRKDNVSDKILLLVPKDKIDKEVKTKHEEIIKQIPQINRGVYDEKQYDKELTKFAKDGDETQLKNDARKEGEKKVAFNEVKNQIYEFDKFEKNPKVFEKKPQGAEKNDGALDIKINSKEDLEQLDDKKIDEIFKRVKLPSEVKIVEYNAYGLPKDSDPEVYKLITNKDFREGIDEFIPAPRNLPVNNYDIDIKPEDMDEEHRELFDAIEQRYEGYEELEDNFVLIANEGKVPIDLLENPEIIKEEPKVEEEALLLNEKKNFDSKKPKYITEEEREYLAKKFNHCFEKEYKVNNEVVEKKEKLNDKVLNEALDEILNKGEKKEQAKPKNMEDDEEYEEYEYDEEEEYEDYEYEDEEDHEEKEESKEAIRKANEGKIKIEYVEKKQSKAKPAQKKKTDDEILNEEIDNAMMDKEIIIKTVELMEGNKSEEDDSEIEEYYMKKPKVYENIETNQSMNNHSNLPKIIPASFKKQNKGEITISKKEKRALLENITNKEKKSTSKPKVDKEAEMSLKIHKINDEETKEQRALRKKLVKEEKKNKRVQKKQLKQLYTAEKMKLMKNVATTNQSQGYGVSVKEV